MRSTISAAIPALAIIASLTGAVQPAAARGCLKGALVGGVAGHYAGHHGVMGAVGGCIVGRHMANKREREAADQQRAYEENTGPQPYREPSVQ